MIKVKVQYTVREVILIVLFYLLLLQNALLEKIPVLGYLDEGVALLGLTVLLFRFFAQENVVLKKTEMVLFGGVLLFVTAGLLSNVIFQYQQLLPVLKDLFACVKFFLAIAAGMELFRTQELEQRKNVLVLHSKLFCIVFIVLLIMNLLLGTFETNKTRYGLPVVQLFYEHPTYLAAASVFLLGILTLFYKKQNNIFIVFALIVLFFTLRSKAIVTATIYVIMFFWVMYLRRNFKFVHMLLIAIAAICLAWDQISYYYFQHSDDAARALLTQTAFKIMRDYFPLGTGFGTFASNVAAESYSSVYFEYGLEVVHGLRENKSYFASDTFWPIVIGQTGMIGTCAYVTVLGVIISKVIKLKRYSNVAHMAGLFVLSYLIMSSTSESAFCNPMAVPLALLLGGILTLERKHRYLENGDPLTERGCEHAED